MANNRLVRCESRDLTDSEFAKAIRKLRHRMANDRGQSK